MVVVYFGGAVMLVVRMLSIVYLLLVVHVMFNDVCMFVYEGVCGCVMLLFIELVI